MRKAFMDGGAGGASPAFWDHAWDEVDLEEELLRLRKGLDPVARQVAEWIRPGASVLEAGSGSGRVLAFLRELGCHALGLDFAVEALYEAQKRLENCPMVAGDVTHFPFQDKSFDCIVSLGVVEHFEEGPKLALLEHRRVIKSDGLLLLSVPRLSPLKRWVDWHEGGFRTNGEYRSWRGLTIKSVRSFGSSLPIRAPTMKPSFYQYEFPRRVLVSALREAGFAPLVVSPTAISFGLMELSFARVLFHQLMASNRKAARTPRRAVIPRNGWHARAFAFLQRLIASEHFSGVSEKILVRFLQLTSGHMFFVVASPEGRAH